MYTYSLSVGTERGVEQGGKVRSIEFTANSGDAAIEEAKRRLPELVCDFHFSEELWFSLECLGKYGGEVPCVLDLKAARR